MSDTPFANHRLCALWAQEKTRFEQSHTRSMALSQAAQAHFLFGVPLHWMRDWPTPGTLFVQSAQGCRLRCVDGHDYRDFCLGDTGAMFGHSPPALVEALARQLPLGLTSMLPAANTAAVGTLLAERFGLPYWQLALSASDANRFVLRWARAITGRDQVLVFDGCYHGAVDDTLVDLDPARGQTLRRPSVLGQVHDHHRHTRVVPFNDLAALANALADGRVAALLAEPALTNCGLVPPQAGFWPAAQALCQAHGTLLVLDETHTLSSGPGGWARQQGLQPDLLVIGKAVAGGLPCAVYGASAAVAERMVASKQAAPPGHSGIGTTLTANALTLAALEAALQQLHTPATYGPMLAAADRLEAGLNAALQAHRRPWTVTRLGARMELQFMPETPQDAQAVRAHHDEGMTALMHLYLLNRGIVLTPFHDMMLCSAATTDADVDRLLAVLNEWLDALDGA